MIDNIKTFFFSLLLSLDSLIYSLINWVYQIILVLCQTNILEGVDAIDQLVNRIYIIIGVVVLFLLAYSLLKSMANPDDIKGKKSPVNIIKDVIISVVLIALVPTIFDFAFGFQNAVLTQNTIGKIILGGQAGAGNTIEQGGINMSLSILETFLHPQYSLCNYSSDTKLYDCDSVVLAAGDVPLVDNLWSFTTDTITFGEVWNRVENTGNFAGIVNFAHSLGHENKMTYNFIISTAVGVYVLIVLVLYCFDIALRIVKLAVFQLIAPLPILARIMPGDQGGKVFSNWIKVTLSTYVEVFVRLAILFFAIFLINIVITNLPNILLGRNLITGDAAFTVYLFAQLLIIVGIIMFIKQAPGILKDITGLDSGKYGKALIKGVGTMASGIGGGATAAIRTAAAEFSDKERPVGQRIRRGLGRGLTAGVGAGAKGVWQGRKTEKLSDISKNAGAASAEYLSARARREEAGGWIPYVADNIKYTAERAKGWAKGSFEAQQQMLELVNEFLKDTKAVKSTAEGFIRDKKYLFKYGEEQEFGEKEIEVDSGFKDKDGNAIMKKQKVARVKITEDTTLSEIESTIQTLKSSGDVEDAKIAAALDSKFNQKIKEIGKELTAVAMDRTKADEFDKHYSSAASKGIERDGMVALDQTQSAYQIVQQKFEANQTLEGVQEFKKNTLEGGTLRTDNVSKLADYLETQSSHIQGNIKMEQDRRKANSKGKKDK